MKRLGFSLCPVGQRQESVAVLVRQQLTYSWGEMETKHYWLAVVNAILLVGFGSRFALKLNFEFIIYVAVIILFFVLVYLSYDRVRYRFLTLVGLTLWSALHLAGGGLNVGDGRLYDTCLLYTSPSPRDATLSRMPSSA